MIMGIRFKTKNSKTARMLKEPSKIPEPIPESLAAIKTAQVSTRTVQPFGLTLTQSEK